ncbi:MAG: type II secretion system protein [bacterium]|nr:type II secretion system protein [bacterium]
MFRTKKGFTLIELLVVIAIIGILASIVLASLNTARMKSRDARRIADIKQIQIALELYFDANSSKYPGTLADLTTGKFMSTVPQDPLSTVAAPKPYLYNKCTDLLYHLGTSLEDDKNPALVGNNNVAVVGCETIGTWGANTLACQSTDPGKYCYDVTP